MGVDLRERRQLDMAEQMAKVRARTRPWRSIIATALALAAATVSRIYSRRAALAAVNAVHAGTAQPGLTSPDRWISIGTAIAFPVFALAATMGLSGKARDTLQPRIGAMHATLVRIVLLIIGVVTTVTVTLSLFGVNVAQLVVGGAVVGVILGIAAQQTLANLFAGIILLQARPFAVGESVWIRSGALGGQYEGAVTEIGLTYVRLDTADGPVSLPNTQVLAAAVGPREPASAGPAAARPQTQASAGPAAARPQTQASAGPSAAEQTQADAGPSAVGPRPVSPFPPDASGQ
jgi:small-conductance mechanosensitive channel